MNTRTFIKSLATLVAAPQILIPVLDDRFQWRVPKQRVLKRYIFKIHNGIYEIESVSWSEGFLLANRIADNPLVIRIKDNKGVCLAKCNGQIADLEPPSDVNRTVEVWRLAADTSLIFPGSSGSTPLT